MTNGSSTSGEMVRTADSGHGPINNDSECPGIAKKKAGMMPAQSTPSKLQN